MARVYKSRQPKTGLFIFLVIFVLFVIAGALAYKKFGQFINGTQNSQYSKTRVNLTEQYSVPGHIYFVKDKNLWVANDGQVTQVTRTNDLTMPALSPDASHIIYPQMELNYSNLLYTNGKGDYISTIKNNKRYFEWNVDPVYSPDGSKIAYLSDQAKNTTGVYDLGVWIYNLTTDRNAQLATANPYTGGDADISWPSADPDYVMYTQYTYFTNDPVIHPHIVISNIQTGASYDVTPQDSNTFEGSVSPDGKWLSYIKRENGEDNLYIMPFNTDTITTTPLSQDNPDYAKSTLLISGTNAQPVFAPQSLDTNGNYLLAYVTQSGDSFELATAQLNNNAKKQTLTLGKTYQITQQSQLDTTSHLYWRE